MKKLLASKLLAAVLMIFALPQLALAQEYPTRNVTIVIPLAAGTGMDLAARFYAEELQKALGRPVVVENQPGAALMLAAQNVARAAPDGHTLLVQSAPVLAINPTLYKKVNYDAEKDFVPIALYAKSPFVLVVNTAIGASTFGDFITKAKADPSKPLNYATPGAGTIQHLAMEMIKREHGLNIDHVPYRSSPQIITDLVGGHIVAAISEAPVALPLITDGKIVALGMTSASRHAQLPQVPTLAEAANKPGFDAVSWHALLAPSATPRRIVDRLASEMARITGMPEFQKRVQEIGLVPEKTASPADVEKFIAGERKRWSAEVKALGLDGKL